MALAKLWNAVFGKRPAADQAPEAKPIAASALGSTTLVTPSQVLNSSSVASAPKPVAKVAAAPKAELRVASSKAPAPKVESTIKLSKSKTKAKSQTGQKSAAESPEVAPPPASVLRMFRRKTNAWSKLLGTRTIKVVLDMNVQDGSRAIELLEAIVDSNVPAPKYVAIGMFELASEKLTVRQFHQKVRSAGGLPVIIPMPLVEGLRHLSQTVGAADLILLDLTDNQFADPVISRLLQRVASKDALLLRRDTNGRWHTIAAQARAA